MADINLTQLIINQLTRAQYDALQPQPNQLYLVTDEPYMDTSYIVTSVGVSSTDLKVPSAKAVYNFVHNNSEGFLKSITGTQVTTALGYTPYNSTNPAGYITGIDSSMVTTALGYTPYNSTNPSGYQTAANVNSAISTHNTNQTAHQDIRNAIVTNLSGLSDVAVSGVTTGQFLAWNGSKWAPSTSSASVSWGGIGGTLSNQTDLQSALNNKVTKNNNITAGTHTKITYDAKGLVTGGASLAAGDIPDLSATYYLASNPNGFITSSYHDSTKQDALPSGTTGQYLQKTASGVQWNTVDALPSQSGQAGKFLTTNGANPRWDTLEALPSQTGHAGSVLTTDGSSASWTGTSECHVVIESYKNGTEWYRLYDDGWVEQGGRHQSTNSNPQTITLQTEMIDTNYFIGGSCAYTGTGSTSLFINTNNKLTTSFQWYGGNTSTVLYWEVKGYAAQQ